MCAARGALAGRPNGPLAGKFGDPCLRDLNLRLNLFPLRQDIYKWASPGHFGSHYVLEKEVGQTKLKRLKLIGETRWSRKSNAVKSIFGGFEVIDVTMFVDLMVCMSVSHFYI